MNKNIPRINRSVSEVNSFSNDKLQNVCDSLSKFIPEDRNDVRWRDAELAKVENELRMRSISHRK